jgi:hypothetical protein
VGIQREQIEVATPAGFEPATFSLEDKISAISSNGLQPAASTKPLRHRLFLSLSTAANLQLIAAKRMLAYLIGTGCDLQLE